jgi:death-on-curing protein
VVRAFHAKLIVEHGGASGVRDESLLDSALARPRNAFAYGNSTPYALAAAYAFGLVRNHPFIDGNKRIGLATAVLFLNLNGYQFVASEQSAAAKTLALAAGGLTEAEYATWLKANAWRLSDGGPGDGMKRPSPPA